MSGADFAGSLRAGDEYERAGDAAEVEALALVLEPVGSACESCREAARRVLAAGYTRRPAAPGGVPVEALRALADEWEADFGRGIVGSLADAAERLRALLPTATTDGGGS